MHQTSPPHRRLLRFVRNEGYWVVSTILLLAKDVANYMGYLDHFSNDGHHIQPAIHVEESEPDLQQGFYFEVDVMLVSRGAGLLE